MSKVHKCLACGATQHTGWGSEFECLECDSHQAHCMDHDKSEHEFQENYVN